MSERGRWGLGPADGLALGVALGGARDARGWRRLLERATAAEELGLHSLWVPEMHFAPGATASPLVVLSAVAARTRRLRLGTTSLLLPVHPPEELAAATAALDRRSGGRLLLGLGRGFRPALFAGFGVDAATRRPRFDAALDRMLELWRHHPACRPAQAPHPPLAVAAFGPKGLAQAARRGLPYLASPVEPDAALGENLARHRADLPPGTPPPVVPAMRTVHVSAGRDEARRVREALESEWRRSLGGRLPSSLRSAAEAAFEERALVGPPVAVAERLARWREQWGLDLLIVRMPEGAVSEREARASLEALASLCSGLSPPAPPPRAA